MPLTSRTRLLDRKINNRDASLILIATEGQETEKQYFSIFRNPKVKVVVIPTTDGKSAPVHVLERLDFIKNQYDLAPDDLLWLMIDIDHNRSREVSRICKTAKQKGFKLAISNPCFEVWLYLHFSDVTNPICNCQEIENELRKILGSYNKSNLDLERYKDHIHLAIERAKALHLNPHERWPNSVGTHVYKVVERLV
jgi:RloB-like protein